MEAFLLILATVLLVSGIIFSVLPPLPGPIITYIGIVATHFASEETSYSTFWLISFAALTLAVTALDVFMPAAATKKFGGTKAGVWGGLIGTFVGIIVPIPLGLIWGPLLGAIIGDLIGGNRIKAAVKSGFGSFLGFVVATALKVIVSIVMGVTVAWRIGGIVMDALMGWI